MSNHPRDYSPLGWSVRDRIEAEEREPKRREAIEYLTADDPRAACFSRYGSTAEECAPVAWRFAYVIAECTGEPITFDQLDDAMSAVVNERDDVASIIRAHGNYRYR